MIQTDCCVHVYACLSLWGVSTRSGMCYPCCLQGSTNRWLHRRTQLPAFHLKCAIKHLWQLARRSLFTAPGHILTVRGCQMWCVWAVYTCNDGVTLVVENTGENLVSVPLQDLQAHSRLSIPQTSCLVWAGCQDPAALGAEADLWREAELEELALFRGGCMLHELQSAK